MPKTVLIVEDDAATREIYTEALSRRGYQVLTATNGAEGVHLARTRRPDLILLDIRMPVLNGWGALRYLKSYRETQTIPVCAISAYSPTEEERQQVEGREFDCFLLKPIDARDLVAEVVNQIGPPPGATVEPPSPEAG